MGGLSLLQGIFPTQGSNPGLPHRRQILYQLSHQSSPSNGGEKKNVLFSSLRTPDPFLLLKGPGLLINLPEELTLSLGYQDDSSLVMPSLGFYPPRPGRTI